MTPELAALSLLAGFIYVISPGPVFFSIMGVLAFSGRKAGSLLSLGALIGDICWIGFGLLSLVASVLFHPLIFKALAIVCGLYLIYLGILALRSRSEASENAAINTSQPFRRGFILGFLNPKAYPVITAVVTGLVGTALPGLPAADIWVLYALIVAGAAAAYALDIVILSLPPIKNAFIRHAAWLARGVGLLFVLFGAKLLLDLIL